MMPTRQIRTSKLDLRLSPDAKARLAAAANERHQSISQFVLESALGRGLGSNGTVNRLKAAWDQVAGYSSPFVLSGRSSPRATASGTANE
jgi:hypothetical protein